MVTKKRNYFLTFLYGQLNTRQNQPEGAVNLLAERIKKYGFETTRALWVVKNNDYFEVFAGGLRLAGATKAKQNVAVLEHIGYTGQLPPFKNGGL